MEYKYCPGENEDKICVISHRKVLTCSRKQLIRQYPDNDFHIVGETEGKRCTEGTAFGNGIDIFGQLYAIEPVGSKNRVFYRCNCFLPVGENQYVALCRSRLPLLFLITGILAGILLFCLMLGHRTDAPRIDPEAVQIPADSSVQETSPQGGGSVTISYTLKARLSLSDGIFRIYFQSPNASNHNLVLDLYLVTDTEEIKVASSGLVPPGYRIETLHLIADRIRLSEGVYKGVYRLSFYQPETGKKADIDSRIENVEIVVSS